MARAPSKLAIVITSNASEAAGALSRTTGNPAGRLRTAMSASISGHITMSPSTRPRIERRAASRAGRS